MEALSVPSSHEKVSGVPVPSIVITYVIVGSHQVYVADVSTVISSRPLPVNTGGVKS